MGRGDGATSPRRGARAGHDGQPRRCLRGKWSRGADHRGRARPRPGVRRRIVRAPDHRRRPPPPPRRRAGPGATLAGRRDGAGDDRGRGRLPRAGDRARDHHLRDPRLGHAQHARRPVGRRVARLPNRPGAGPRHRRRAPAVHGADCGRGRECRRARVPLAGHARRGRAVAPAVRVRVDPRDDRSPDRHDDRLRARRPRVPDAPAPGAARGAPVMGERPSHRFAGDARQRRARGRRRRALRRPGRRAGAARRHGRPAARLPQPRRLARRRVRAASRP